ncbi:MAG: hypothetical protein ACD_79C00910G0001 [uncultured bacterium]|nr:MAG: hypothetical protein ACD_79C00910G0001 [uncultured bacterium]
MLSAIRDLIFKINKRDVIAKPSILFIRQGTKGFKSGVYMEINEYFETFCDAAWKQKRGFCNYIKELI